jgi:hypothetical protein
LITYQQGGTVTIELRPGRDLYGCSERNGVTTSGYGPYQHSFVFKLQNRGGGARRRRTDICPVEYVGRDRQIRNGKTYKFKCPAVAKKA